MTIHEVVHSKERVLTCEMNVYSGKCRGLVLNTSSQNVNHPSVFKSIISKSNISKCQPSVCVRINHLKIKHLKTSTICVCSNRSSQNQSSQNVIIHPRVFASIIIFALTDVWQRTVFYLLIKKDLSYLEIDLTLIYQKLFQFFTSW